MRKLGAAPIVALAAGLSAPVLADDLSTLKGEDLRGATVLLPSGHKAFSADQVEELTQRGLSVLDVPGAPKRYEGYFPVQVADVDTDADGNVTSLRVQLKNDEFLGGDTYCIDVEDVASVRELSSVTDGRSNWSAVILGEHQKYTKGLCEGTLWTSNDSGQSTYDAARVLAEKNKKEELAKKQAEAEAAKKKAEQDALAKKQADEKAAQEALAKKQAEAEAARKKAEAEALAQKQADEKAAQKALAKKQAEEKAVQEALAKKQADEKAAQEALAKKQAEEKAAQEALAKKQAEEKAAQDALAKKQADEKAAQEALAKKQAEEKAAQEALAKKHAEEKAAQDALAKKQADEKAAQDALAKKQADEKAAQDALAKKQAEEKAAQDALAKKQAEAEEARKKAEEKAKAEALLEQKKAERLASANIQERIDNADIDTAWTRAEFENNTETVLWDLEEKAREIALGASFEVSVELTKLSTKGGVAAIELMFKDRDGKIILLFPLRSDFDHELAGLVELDDGSKPSRSIENYLAANALYMELSGNMIAIGNEIELKEPNLRKQIEDIDLNLRKLIDGTNTTALVFEEDRVKFKDLASNYWQLKGDLDIAVNAGDREKVTDLHEKLAELMLEAWTVGLRFEQSMGTINTLTIASNNLGPKVEKLKEIEVAGNLRRDYSSDLNDVIAELNKMRAQYNFESQNFRRKLLVSELPDRMDEINGLQELMRSASGNHEKKYRFLIRKMDNFGIDSLVSVTVMNGMTLLTLQDEQGKLITLKVEMQEGVPQGKESWLRDKDKVFSPSISSAFLGDVHFYGGKDNYLVPLLYALSELDWDRSVSKNISTNLVSVSKEKKLGLSLDDIVGGTVTGVWENPDGTKLESTWKDALPHGQSKYTDAEGNEIKLVLFNGVGNFVVGDKAFVLKWVGDHFEVTEDHRVQIVKPNRDGLNLFEKAGRDIAASRAEYVRLEGEMKSLAKRNAWAGVNDKYQELLDLNNIEISPDTHVMGAQAAESLGDIGEARKRWNFADPNSPRVAEIDRDYGHVRIEATKGGYLTRPDGFDDPRMWNAFNNAKNNLVDEFEFDGYLPAGEYLYNGVTFKVEAGKDNGTITVE